MKAITLEKPQTLRLVEIPEPNAPGPGEALIRVHRVGICGTDLSGYMGRLPFLSYPRIPGHELGVEVLAIGTGVANVQAGDRCVVEPYVNDPGSFASRNGHPNCCENLRVLGVHIDGGLRPRFVLPARKLHPANRLSYEQAALVEPLAIGSHAVSRAACQAGQTVLVIGAGAIGLSVIESTKLAGARTIVMDSTSGRLEFVRDRMGIPDVVLAKGDASDIQQIDHLTGGHLAQFVIDCTGSNRSMANALKFAGFAGRVVFVGLSTQEISFSHLLMHRRELSLLASRNALPVDFKRVIEFIEAGRIDTRSWMTHSAGFNEVIGEFGKWLNPATGVIRAIVRLD